MVLIKSNRSTFFNLVILLIIFLIFNTCSEDRPTEPSNDDQNISTNISLGEFVQETSQDVNVSGGTITIANSSSEINGLSINIPNGSHESVRNYTISYANISDHKLGETFNPITPLINIKNGGGYAQKPISVKIPITFEDGEFPMGFLYDEISGKIEPLPILEQTEDFIIVETRHFALSTILSKKTLGKTTDDISAGNIVISSIDENQMMGQSLVTSGFSPGVDDWEFINYGSYIAPGDIVLDKVLQQCGTIMKKN